MTHDADDEDDQGEHLTLPRVFGGQYARTELAQLIGSATGRLILNAGNVARIDAYGGAVLGIALRLHLARGTHNRVLIIEPTSDSAWSMMYDLLGEVLPERCTWAGTRSAPTRGRLVVVPAASLSDDEDVELLTDEALPRATSALRFGTRAGRLLQEGAAAFLENARTHGADAPVEPVACAALDTQTNDLQLVVIDLGPNIPADGQAAVHTMVSSSRARAREHGSGLQSLVGPAREGMDFSVRLAHGTGRAHYRTARSWHFSTGSHVPGFIAGVEIHR
jgi:hypothetical protein